MLTIKDLQHDEQQRNQGWLGPAPWIDVPPPGPRAKAIIDREQPVKSPTYTRDYPLVVNRAHGSIVEDVDGNRYLDLAAGIGVCAAGHTHEKVVAAIEAQARKLIHICGCDFYYEPMVALAEKLAAITPIKGDHARVIMTNSGAETVEAGIKLARYHTGRPWIIGFYGGFHGRTMGALSVTCSKAVQRKRFGPFVPMIEHVPFGDAAEIENELFKRKLCPDEVAAILVEPIQGEGGYIFPPDNFLADLRRICDKHGILLMFDEIQSGMGRTGKWFACEHWKVKPDIMFSAKGLAGGMPLGAVIASDSVMTWGPGSHGSTYGGNPVSCAAALATIDLVESGYMANAAKLGIYALERLSEIAERQRVIRNVRGKGLMIAVDVVNRTNGKPDPDLRARILNECFSRGIILLGCGFHSIRVIPPLCINKTQLEMGLQIFDESLATVS